MITHCKYTQSSSIIGTLSIGSTAKTIQEAKKTKKKQSRNKTRTFRTRVIANDASMRPTKAKSSSESNDKYYNKKQKLNSALLVLTLLGRKYLQLTRDLLCGI